MTISLAKRAALYIGILAFAFVLLLFLGAGQASAEDVSGDIIGDDVVWTSGGVYNVTGNVNVLGNLTIENNVTVIFQGVYRFDVYGGLDIQGSADYPVLFTVNTSAASIYQGIFFEQGSMGNIAFLNIEYTNTAVYIDNTTAVTCSNINIDNTNWGFFIDFYGVDQAPVIALTDIHITNAYQVVLRAYNTNGSLSVVLERVVSDHTNRVAILEASNYLGTGTLDLTLTDCDFNDSSYGMELEADIVSEITVSGTSFKDMVNGLMVEDVSGDLSMIIDGALFQDIIEDGVYVNSDALIDFQVWNSVFINIGDCGVELYSQNKDMNFVMNNVTMENVGYGGFNVDVLNGSAVAELTDVHMNNVYWIGGWAVETLEGTTGRLDFSISGSSFNDSAYALWFGSEVAGDITVTDTEFTNMGYAVFYFFNSPAGDLNMVLQNVFMDNVWMGIDPVVAGNISLVLESVQINNTYALGYFEAHNADNNAVIDVVMNGCSFSNATNGFYFEADTIGDLQITNTVFSSIYYYAVSMNLDHADMIVQIDGVQAMGVGSFLDLTVTFGNVELVITDSVLAGNNDTGVFLIDVTVNSNSLDNGFVTLTVVNSTFMNAGGGIRTWSEELNPIDLSTTLFENIIGEAMHFDVRSGDLDFTFVDDDLTVINSGTGLWAYANDGDIQVNLSGVYLNTYEFGVLVEVSSLSAEDMNVINMNIVDSVFEDGAYGVHALSQNGGIVTIDNTQFLGHGVAGYWFDSLFGEMVVEITDSVFDGSSAADMTVYMVEEVENTYQLIGRNYWTMGVDAWNGGGALIDLPFAFNYNGDEYTQVYMDEDGRLGFAMGQEILPVGDTNLVYDYEHFFGYKVAEDGMSVMFQWYASEWYSWFELSSTFQVVLFADGTIQFNYGDMESYSYDVPYGLMTSYSDTYDLNSLYDMPKWEADQMAFLFTPLPISYGMAALLTMEEGSISAVITNNTVTGYYNGGIAVMSLDGDLSIEVTGNDFSNIVGDDFASLQIFNHNGESDVTMADNSFERIWGLAISLYMSSTHGGVKSVDMSDSVFNKVGYVLYSVIEVYDNTGRTGNDTLDVTVNFQNNVMTDAYGLVCWIDLYLYDEVDWTVNVEQIMTNNVMIQENYMGSWPFMTGFPMSSALGSAVYIVQQNEDENSVTLEQTATVTGNYIECPGPWGIDIGNAIYNHYGDTTKSAVIDISDNLLNVTGSSGINVWSETYTGVGNVVDDASITIENNEINDGAQNINAIYVYVEVDSILGLDFDQSGDADITTYVSVSDNLVEGAYFGVISEIYYYQDNLVGDWNVALTSHMDGNQLLNVSYAIDATMYAGVEFSNNYWPPENETAVANLVLDYLYTVDDNVVTCPYFMSSWDDMIYVDIEYWGWIQTGTVSLAAETYAWITGTLSISGNEITLEGYVYGIELYHWLGAQKSSWIWVDVDVAVDNNVLLEIPDDGSYGPLDAIYIYSETDVRCDDSIITPVGATVDMTWSVTGNQIIGFEDGIEVYEEIDLEEGVSCLDYDVTWDISGNTLTGIRDEGISYELDREDDDTFGTIEMTIAVDIENNVVSMQDIDESDSGIFLDSCESTNSWEYWDEQYGNHTFVASVSGNTVSHAYYGIEIYGTLYFDVPVDYELTGDEVFYTYVNDIVVENNYVNDSWYGMYLYDGMDVRNNIVECDIGAPFYGIYWYEGEGELVGNTITAEYAVEIEYLHHLLVQGNLIQFGATGMYIYYYDDEEDADGVIVDNIITALENPFLPWSSYGIELYYVPNVLISGNVISGADYGVDIYYVWNITIADNEISDAYGAGIYVYDAWFVWIESNEVTGCYYGLYISSNMEDLVVGNNTFTENYYGIYMYEEVHRMVLWNNVFIDNEYGTDIYSYLYMEAVWYVDAQCQSTRSDLEFNGPLFVLAGGSMVLEDMELWISGGLTVDEGGLLSMSSVYADECWFIDVAGTFWASLSVFEDTNVNLGPTAEAEIRTSTFYYSEMVVDGSAPVIADNLFIGYSDGYGIVVKNGAAPSIVSNIIALYSVGIYANGMDMGGIYDNLIVGNFMAGLLTENCTGAIHDNIFLLNKVEILLRNSDVSVEDNEIGYTNMFQVIANYAPILGHFVSLGVEDTETATEDPQAAMDSILASSWSDIGSWIKAHNGIWSEGSTVRTSGNVYGLVNYALYAVDSEIHFADDVRTIVLNVPHANDGEMFNYSLSLYTMNGLYAARSQVWVDGSTIEVLDDALVFEASEAWVEGATLLAGDFDYFVFGGSDVYNIATTYAKAKVMDSHSLNEGTWMTLTALDEGDPAANVSVLIKNAKGEIVYNGTTDADGKVRILLIQYSYTSEGKDDGFNPYTITADFESGEKSMDVVLDKSYQDVTIEGEEESDMGAILAVVGVLVIILLIVAAVVVMRRRK
ncbi:MAG: right-handed parallel beta-helix repeat-containing protein [Methanomassiliicoccales archaeon]